MSCMELLVINLVSHLLPTLQPRTSAFGHPPPNPQIFLDTHSRRPGWGGVGRDSDGILLQKDMEA